MCGIVGILHPAGNPVDGGVLAAMRDTLRHRGPDDAGLYVSGNVGLGARRLAIIDLSSRARQPITNEDGTLHLVFNGEIYNFQELRAILKSKGHRFVSESDGEAIVHLYEEYELGCVNHLRGMFAFAIWDESRRRLFLARDRLGKKPLYYSETPSAFLFSSEIKGILAYPGIPRRPNIRAMHQYFALQYVPAPLTFYDGIASLPPAHVLTWQGGEIHIRRYWRLGYSDKLDIPEKKARDLLLEHLEEAVRIRLFADVPLGIHLSGGIDSSVVAAFASRLVGRGVRSFSIGFPASGFNELPYARAVAQHIGTDHYEYVVGPEAVRNLPELIRLFDQPFADPSMLPTFHLCRITREHVTVALNGDGGDENFVGYDRYRERLAFAVYEHLPRVLKGGLVAVAVRKAAEMTGDPRFGRVSHFLEYAAEPRIRRYARGMCQFSPEQLRQLYTDEFRALTMSWDPLESLLALNGAVTADSLLEQLLGIDVLSYLPHDLLVKTDITSMANSLEVRSPFLDHVFMEFVARLPSHYKLRGRTAKYLLKEAMKQVLPREIIRRPKAGFTVPLAQWFREDLRPVAYEILLDDAVARRGVFRVAAVRRLLDEHASGLKNWAVQIWNLLVFEVASRQFLDSVPARDRTGALLASRGP